MGAAMTQIKGLAGAAIIAATTIGPAAHSDAWPVTGQRTTRMYTARSTDGSRRGRPRKFDRPSRAVTLTLPEDVIATLQAMDVDLSRAVVRAAQPMAARTPQRPAELISYGNRSVIMVPRSRVLRERTGVELIPVADGRALISMDERLSLAQLELKLTDALGDPALDRDGRDLFEALVAILKGARTDDTVQLQQRNVIILQRRSDSRT